MSQKGFAQIFLLIGLLIIIAIGGVYLIIKNNRQDNIPQEVTNIPIPQKPQFSNIPTPTQLPVGINQEVYSIDPLVNGKLLKACGKGLTEFPESAVSSLKTSAYVDLAHNKLTSLTINQDWQKIKEINLIGNNFPADQQVNIQKMLPNTKVAFIPQNDFNALVTENWKRYSNPKYHFTFNYHPDLLISEKDNKIKVNNDLTFFESAFASCSSQDDFFDISLAEKANPQNLTTLQYINKDFNSDKYGEITVKGSASRMISQIKPYKNAAIEGVTFDAGESEHHIIYASQGNYMYVFQIWPGGETGSIIGDIPKKVFYNILSTVNFN